MRISHSKSFLTALWVGCSSLFYPTTSANAALPSDGALEACKSMVKSVEDYKRVNSILSPVEEIKVQLFSQDAEAKCEKDASSQLKVLSRELERTKARLPDYKGIDLFRSRATQEVCEGYGAFVLKYSQFKGYVQSAADEIAFLKEIKATCAHNPNDLQHSLIGELHYKAVLDGYMDNEPNQYAVSITMRAVSSYQTRASRVFCAFIGEEYAKIKPLSSQKIEEICTTDAQKGMIQFAEGLHFSQWANRQKKDIRTSSNTISTSGTAAHP